MNNKKIGGVLLIISFLLLAIFIYSTQGLEEKSDKMGCYSNEECGPIERSLSILHFGFGIFGFILALGFYLIFFSSGEEAILKKLNKEETRLNVEEKFKILLLGLDKFEKEVIEHLRKQPEINQNTLKLRVDMSKAKLSQILTGLEKKGLIKRVPQKKTLTIHLITPFLGDER